MSTVEQGNFMTLVHRYGANPTQEGYDAIYKRYLGDCGAAPTTSPEPDAVREALRRIRDFPHNDTMCEQAMAQIAREAMASAPAPSLTPEMRRLIVAARIVAFEDQGPTAIKALDEASEAFADQVPWDNEPLARNDRQNGEPRS